MNTTPQERLMQVSDEANQKQLDLARQQGQAYLKALNHMAHDVADTGGEKPAGDYVIAYAVEHAEGMYHREGDAARLARARGRERPHRDLGT